MDFIPPSPRPLPKVDQTGESNERATELNEISRHKLLLKCSLREAKFNCARLGGTIRAQQAFSGPSPSAPPPGRHCSRRN